MRQDTLLDLYRRATRLVFNLVVLALLVGLFAGVGRTFLELGLTLTEPTVRLGLKDLITNVLSLVIVLELVRVFVEYFEFERVRLEVLLEVGIALALRELLLLLFAERISGTDLFLWSLGILAMVAGRTLAVRFPPERRRA
ncbi:phosphate-starvation-inducible PsiE family protein [Thermus sp.]|uniref:phosphate-starvation-inducible PsiE family protein n=1 Tax=Thermus sp. TaxID=275 RepID=UPI003D13934C